ncbi:sulfatase-like hydrolase/transferase [Streptomyces sp. M10(2022)]
MVYDEDGEPVRLPGYRSDALIDAAIRFVADHHDRPYLLFLSLLEPHHQNPTDDYPAPPATASATRAAGCRRTWPRSRRGTAGRCAPPPRWISRPDQAGRRRVGRLRDALRSLGTQDRTVLAWTADHGSHFRTRNSEYKRSAHDASVRVPFVLTGPGFTGGGLVREPVGTVDLMPTLLAAAGIAVPAACKGAPDAADRWAQRSGPAGIRVRPDQRGPGGTRGSHLAMEVRGGGTGADAWNEPDADRYTETELYDLAADPYELDNLAGLTSHRAVADELRGQLLEWLERIEDAEPEIELAAPRPAGQRRADPFPDGAPWEGTAFGHRPRR